MGEYMNPWKNQIVVINGFEFTRKIEGTILFEQVCIYLQHIEVMSYIYFHKQALSKWKAGHQSKDDAKNHDAQGLSKAATGVKRGELYLEKKKRNHTVV